MDTIRSVNANSDALSCIADTTKMVFQISKQVVVTGGQVIRLLHASRVTNSLLGNHRLVDLAADCRLQCRIYNKVRGARLSYIRSCK